MLTHILVIGRRLDHRSGGAIGASAVDEARRIQANLCFVSDCAVAAGVCAFDQEEAILKEPMIHASAVVAVVAAADKFKTRALFVVAPTSMLTHLVVEAATDATLLAPFVVAVHVVGSRRMSETVIERGLLSRRSLRPRRSSRSTESDTLAIETQRRRGPPHRHESLSSCLQSHRLPGFDGPHCGDRQSKRLHTVLSRH